MIKDKNFYNKESPYYSVKRYPNVASNYIQYFFKKRLGIVLGEIQRRLRGRSGLRLLEVGCADGIVLRKVFEQMSSMFSEMIGMDISEGMIEEAINTTTIGKIKYFIRGEESVGSKYDLILEIGVANYADINEELKYARNNLSQDGLYILSLAGSGSVNGYFSNGDGYNNFFPYSEYEAKIKDQFAILKIIPVGFYIPIIWKMPCVARVIQIFVDYIFSSLFANLFHEKVYILKHK
ncbi:MAG: class I SAM-dependent methyltransferase [Candidatus Vogelbacteria bacterium]|nr:class I SAM-dependent methyltransferase [Candidatus Vogelbacteria bacterium]